MNDLYLVSLAASITALVFARLQSKKVLAFSEGTPLMQKISRAIRTGASAFLKRQYRTVAIFFACRFAVLCGMAAAGFVTWFVPFAFVTGGFFSCLSGFQRLFQAINCKDHRPVFTGIACFPIGLHRPQCHLIVVGHDKFDLFSVLADQTVHAVLRLSPVPVR